MYADDTAEAPAAEQSYHQYRVEMSSVSGMYEQYSGCVTVWSPTNDRAALFERAVSELQRTSFPDRNRSMWRMGEATRLR